MFPTVKICVSGLEATTKYIVLMEVVPVDDFRYKYHNSEWIATGKGEPHVYGRVYIHPDSPASGGHWTKQIISFHKMKLTNNSANSNGQIVLNSMHKYLPRLHIVEASDAFTLRSSNSSSSCSSCSSCVVSFAFQETSFVAVTAYQNEEITQLKIDNNPFAKGFREPTTMTNNGNDEISICKRKSTINEEQDIRKKKHFPKNEHGTHNSTRPVACSQLPALLASSTQQLSSSASENDRQQVKMARRELSNKLPASDPSVKMTPQRRTLQLSGETKDPETNGASVFSGNGRPQRLSPASASNNWYYQRKEKLLSSCVRSQCQYNYQPLETNLNPYLPHIHSQIPFCTELRLQAAAAAAGDNEASKCDLGSSLRRFLFDSQGRYELTSADYHEYVKAIHGGHGYGLTDDDKFVKDQSKSSY